jgi:hypothetical protein
LKEIRNALGTFFEVDMNVGKIGIMEIVPIWVGINLKEGWLQIWNCKEDISLLKPFKCVQCHEYGHVVHNCRLPFYLKAWEKSRCHDCVKYVGKLSNEGHVENGEAKDVRNESMQFDRPIVAKGSPLVVSQGVPESLKDYLGEQLVAKIGGSDPVKEIEGSKTPPDNIFPIEGMSISKLVPMCSYSPIFKGFGVVSNFMGDAHDVTKGRDVISRTVNDGRVYSN